MPYGANSEPNEVDQCCKNALLPEYVARSGVGRKPAKEPIVRIRPRFRSIMPGTTSWVTRRVPRQLMVMISSISSSGVSANGTGMEWLSPTLLIRMEMSRSLIRACSLT